MPGCTYSGVTFEQKIIQMSRVCPVCHTWVGEGKVRWGTPPVGKSGGYPLPPVVRSGEVPLQNFNIQISETSFNVDRCEARVSTSIL